MATVLAVTHWENSIAPDDGITLLDIPHFNARGMKRKYGRGDHFARGIVMNLDLWRNRHGQFLVRFWSRYSEVDGQSVQVIGQNVEYPFGDERWIPACLREYYDEWIHNNLF
jgi:hypothetical protein